MEHIHLLVSTFDTSNVAVAHNLIRSCSRPPSETKTKTKTSKKWSWSVSRPRPGLESHIPGDYDYDVSAANTKHSPKNFHEELAADYDDDTPNASSSPETTVSEEMRQYLKLCRLEMSVLCSGGK